MTLSIVTSLYRSAPYLPEFYRRARAAALALTPDYEIVLVDDGSPDHSFAEAVKLRDADDRVTQLVSLAVEQGVTVRDSTKGHLDTLADGQTHQGVALEVPPYVYAEPEDLLEAPSPVRILIADHIQDPRNLGAIMRSAAAFGASGVVVPERRAAGVTVAAWKVSAGAAARRRGAGAAGRGLRHGVALGENTAVEVAPDGRALVSGLGRAHSVRPSGDGGVLVRSYGAGGYVPAG